MGRAVNEASARFKLGDRVKVKFEDRPGHLRTPWYIRGKSGWVERVYGEFLNPESLAFGHNGLPKKILYLVAFNQTDVWYDAAKSRDKILIDIYEHWLEPTGGDAP